MKPRKNYFVEKTNVRYGLCLRPIVIYKYFRNVRIILSGNSLKERKENELCG